MRLLLLQQLLHSYLSNWRMHAHTQHGQQMLLVASFLCHHVLYYAYILHQESYMSLRSRGRTHQDATRAV